MNTRPEDIVDVEPPEPGPDEPAEADDAAPPEEGDDAPDAGNREAAEIERLAAEIGWSPKDEWRGDPDDWKDAAEFLRGNVQATKALRETVRKQDSRLEEMNETVKRMNSAAEKANKRAYEKALTDLKAQQREAVAEGDTEAWERAEQEIEKLREDAPDSGQQKSTPDADPNFVTFQRDNPWYGGTSNLDIRKTAFAEQMAPSVGRNYQGEAFYRKIAELVEEEFKESTVNPNRQRANRVESGNGQMRRGSNTKKTYQDLPPEAKQACDNFVADGALTREQYVEDYFSQE